MLFRIFNYPSRPVPPRAWTRWGVGEHTDYGLLTLLRQDDVGGLEVRTAAGWIDAPPLPRLVRLQHRRHARPDDRRPATARTPHRVRINSSGRDRLSFPFFFDPDFDAAIEPLPHSPRPTTSATRWDGASVHAFEGTYGDYVLAKVGKVFPELKRSVL